MIQINLFIFCNSILCMSNQSLLSHNLTSVPNINCRICLEELDVKQNPSLCDCKGSTAYHHKCLTNYINSQRTPKLACEVCKKPYGKDGNYIFLEKNAYPCSKVMYSNQFYFLLMFSLIIAGVLVVIYVNIEDNTAPKIFICCVVSVIYLIYLVKGINNIRQDIMIKKYSIKKSSPSPTGIIITIENSSSCV